MSAHFTGPLLNKENNNGSRVRYSNKPLSNEPGYIRYMWDWVNPSEYDSTNDWVQIKDTGASVAVGTDADGGTLVLTSTATTDNDGASIQSAQECFSLSSGKQLWFEARLQVSDADDMDVFVGLSDAFATNPEAVLTSADRCGFQIDDGNASILCKAEKNGTESSTDSAKDAADATNVVLSFYWDGKNKIEYSVDGALVATHTSNIPDDEQLAVALFELSGSATGTKSLTCDYIEVVQER